MATYTGTKGDLGNPRQGVRDWAVLGSFTITTALVAADVIHLCDIPAGAAIKNVVLDIPATGTGTTATISVGDNAQTYATTGQATRLIPNTGLTTSTAAQFVSQMVSGTPLSLGRFYTTADKVFLTITTAAQTAAATGAVLNYMVEMTQDK